MTIIEVIKKYGDADGYVTCSECPIKCKCFDDHMSGYYDCWEKIRLYLDKQETNQFSPEMMDCLDGILCDINPAEIASQIERDHLGQWCETIRAEILKKVSDKDGK